jgi:hypothetical protein
MAKGCVPDPGARGRHVDEAAVFGIEQVCGALV